MKQHKDLARIMKCLRDLTDDIKGRYKSEIIGIFGSYVRGEQKKGSDVDVMVRFFDNATLFDFVGLADFLEARLNVKVDIVPVDTVREEIRDYVLKETLYI